MIRRYITLIVVVILIIWFFIYKTKNIQGGHIEYNCKDFMNQKAAQDIFNNNVKDVYRLDGDHDGIACENLK